MSKFINQITFQPAIRGYGVNILYQLSDKYEPEIIGNILLSDSMECYHFSVEDGFKYILLQGKHLKQILDKINLLNSTIELDDHNEIFYPPEGYVNRHIHPLPNEVCRIVILVKELGVYKEFYCEWEPFDPQQYEQFNMPSENYLGTASTINGETQIGFHAWRQNNNEFIYYKKL